MSSETAILSSFDDHLELEEGKMQVPKGFIINKKGLFILEKIEDEEGIEREVEVRIGPPLTVEALVRDNRSEDWGWLLVFSDHDGIPHRWICPATYLGAETREFHKELARLGYLLSPGLRNKRLLEQYVQTSFPMTRIRLVKKIGWNNNNEVFVLPDETFGKTCHERIMYQGETTDHHFLSLGSLKDWRDNISQFCSGNSRLVFALSVAFAPPLLSLAGIESGVIHFFGSSSAGKTTTLRVAASVWGSRDYVRSWRATDNGLESTLMGLNDCLCVFDELGQSDPRISGPAAYLIANGQAKMRANRSGDARKVCTWRTIALSSGEIPISTHMSVGGESPRAGVLVRFVDIPAEVKTGSVFQDLHGFKNGSLFSGYLNDASQKYYGTPIRAFLKEITKRQEDVKSFILKGMSDFLTKNLPEGAEGQVRRVADRFGLISAAGEMATEFGITGWRAGEAEQAASSCFRDWLLHRGGSENQEKNQILSQVQHFFEANGASRFQPYDSNDDVTKIPNRVGYRVVENGETFFWVFQESFRTEILKGLNFHIATRILKEVGWLIPDGDGKHNSQRKFLPRTRGRKRMYVFSSEVLGSDPDGAGVHVPSDR